MTAKRTRQQKGSAHPSRTMRTTGHWRWPRMLAFGALAAVVLAAAAYFLWPVVKPSGASTPGAVKVQLSMGGFSPSSIEGQVGQPITLLLVNKDNQFHAEWDGGGWHQFASEDLDINTKVAPLETRELTFTPSKAGRFEFYCEICCGGRANPYMVGTLTIKG